MIVCCCIKAASLCSAQTNHATYTFNARTMHVCASSISLIKKLRTSDHWLLFLWNHVKPRHFFCFSLSILGTNYILTIRFGIPTVLHTTHHLQFVHRAIMSTKLKLAFNILEVHRASLLLAAMLPGYADTDTSTRYGDTPIRHFSKNKDTRIRQYI